jgi:hypothetical protein
MKKFVAVVFAVLVAAPVLAGDGQVSQKDLAALGLGKLQSMSDSQGMAVRGLSSNAASGGQSLLFAQLSFTDANGTQFVLGADVNVSATSAENAGLNASSTALHSQGSGVIISLGPIVNLAGLQFLGSATGQGGQTTLPGFAGNGFAQGF